MTHNQDRIDSINKDHAEFLKTNKQREVLQQNIESVIKKFKEIDND